MATAATTRSSFQRPRMLSTVTHGTRAALSRTSYALKRVVRGGSPARAGAAEAWAPTASLAIKCISAAAGAPRGAVRTVDGHRERGVAACMSQGRRSHREPRGGYGGAALGGAAAAAAAAACVAAEGEAEADSKAAGDPQRGASKSSESKGAATGGGAPAAGAEARYEWFLNAHGSAEWDGNWDLRAGSTAEAQKWGRRRAGGRGTNYIYLIRCVPRPRRGCAGLPPPTPC